MKPIDYDNNGRGLFVQYHVMREGPNYFLIHYKNTSVLRQDPKDAWRVMGSAKFTANSQALKQWCLDIHDKWSKKKEESRNVSSEGHKDTSFASDVEREQDSHSEAMAEEEDPTANTKMVV